MTQTKICTKCHMEKELTEFYKNKAGKYGVKATCKSCDKLYCQENAEYIAERTKQYCNDNREYISKRMKKWKEDNQEYLAIYMQQWRKDNAVDHKKYDKQYREENKEQIAMRMKQWAQTPKGKAAIKAAKHNRRAAKLSAKGNHTSAEILGLFELQSGVCPYCKVKLHKTKRNSFHVDHILPLSKGGSNDISNIQLLCPKCNMSKHDKLPEEFASNFNKLF